MLAVLGRRTAQAAAALPLLVQQARHISTTQPAADLRDFLDAIDPQYATNGENVHVNRYNGQQVQCFTVYSASGEEQ